ncbi:NAD(P)-binding domain-containing protein [Flavobacterium sp. MK4S-17]|uniref:NAD(P)-binding domain-containing protein n=1 Tax=Flavobacterium sp. MK4S-17 TaxID=2543737 RepID=UPI00135C9ACF|nr:NAD(P)-binding domain-containing protein [Flavobacterium sp. MK4S-17]
MNIKDFPVAIIGAGPVGMAAAAHLVERNIPFLLFEAGSSVGANLLDWGHVRVFSPWRYNINKAAENLLLKMTWKKPGEDGLPTGEELVKEYLLPLSFHPSIEPHLHLNSKVVAITKKGLDKMHTAGRADTPFIITVQQGSNLGTFEASAVIDASGTWQNPNPIGVGGIFAPGELENSERITYRIPDILGKDQHRYANKSVLVIGAGHSAINSLLDLAKLKESHPQITLHWALHTESLAKVYGGQENDALEARGALGIKIEQLVKSGQLHIHTPYYIHGLTAEASRLTIKGYIKSQYHELKGIEEIIANTGARPDFTVLREVRVAQDPALECFPDLAELIDPNVHSCGTVRPHGELELRQPEPNFYVVGVKSYGRAPTFLMATGYEQVRSIAAWLDGDIEAGQRVELDLPETGVCSSHNDDGTACCGVQPASSTKENQAAACCTPVQSDNKNQDSSQMETLVKTNNEKPVEVATTSCCGGAPTSNADACCKLDEEKKAEGEAGCGCNTAFTASAPKASACCG